MSMLGVVKGAIKLSVVVKLTLILLCMQPVGKGKPIQWELQLFA